MSEESLSYKFPVDFMFQIAPQDVTDMWSQIVTGSQKHREESSTRRRENAKRLF